MNPETRFPIAIAPKRDSRHWEMSEVTWQEIVDWMDKPASRKEAGNYLLGTLRETTIQHTDSAGRAEGEPCTALHRRKDAVVSRSALTLDVDTPADGFLEIAEMVLPWTFIAHTTFNSAPDSPRYRLIVPTDRAMAPDEYIAAAHVVMKALGKESFDPGSDQPERYMFRPSAKQKGWFSHAVVYGQTACVDELLADWDADLSDKPMPTPSRKKRDPFELEGVIGAFNRAYEDWDLLIEEYELPYDKVAEDRYHLIGARSEAGMGPVAGVAGLVYSHHANDPAYGKTCSAFDLVRLHRFGELDERSKPQTPVNKLPSHAAMLELAAGDYRVTAELVGLDFDVVMDEAEDDENGKAWMLDLRRSSSDSSVKDDIRNWDLITKHDDVFRILCYSELSLSPEADGDLPWRTVTDRTRTFDDTDRWALMHYLERKYRLIVSKTRIDSFVDTTAAQRKFNPVRDYLNSLTWDRTPRVETCLPGVASTPYTRTVARKCLVAAVARMLDPGCKWDHTLVIFGSEGLGKSGWIDRVAKGFSSSLGRIDNKDTLLIMQRSWIMTADEGHSIRKADSDAMKEFLTRQSDVFRMPYDRETLAHPRHCVIWSTTNDETFLRRQEGNRRYLIVHSEGKVDFEAMTEEYIDQLWAEAVYLYRAGELLYLTDEEASEAAKERERFVEEDSLAGIIQEYLDQKIPANWWSLSPDGRIEWLRDRDNGFVAEGEFTITQTCSRQIWKEALLQRGEPRRTDLLDITEALKRVPGWAAVGTRRIPGYGPQLTFTREDDIL